MVGNQKFTRSKSLKFIAGLIALVLLLVTALAQPLSVGMWQRTFHESLHVPVFGIIAICLLILTPSRWKRRKRILVVTGLVVALSILTEIAQIPTARDASASDVVSDLLGAGGFLAIAVVFSSSISVPKGRGRYLVILGIALLILPLKPLAFVSAAYYERNNALPTLASFEGNFGHAFFRLQNADIKIVERPDTNSVVAEILLKDGAWPGIIFHDIWPNWQPYTALIFDIDNPDDDPLPLGVRVHDVTHSRGDQPYRDRFNRMLELAPGPNTIRIPLDEIRTAPAGREMNMSEIEGLAIFATRAEAGRRFQLREVFLE